MAGGYHIFPKKNAHSKRKTTRNTATSSSTQPTIETSTLHSLPSPYLDLPLHGDAEERDEVHDQDGPEDGDVEHLEGGEPEGDGGGLHHAVPELELWQTPLERPELVRRAGG